MSPASTRKPSRVSRSRSGPASRDGWQPTTGSSTTCTPGPTRCRCPAEIKSLYGNSLLAAARSRRSAARDHRPLRRRRRALYRRPHSTHGDRLEPGVDRSVQRDSLRRDPGGRFYRPADRSSELAFPVHLLRTDAVGGQALRRALDRDRDGPRRLQRRERSLRPSRRRPLPQGSRSYPEGAHARRRRARALRGRRVHRDACPRRPTSKPVSSPTVSRMGSRRRSSTSAIGSTLEVGISLGLASYPAAGQSLESLLMAADKNMYEDKARRKGREAAAPTRTAISRACSRPRSCRVSVRLRSASRALLRDRLLRHSGSDAVPDCPTACSLRAPSDREPGRLTPASNMFSGRERALAILDGRGWSRVQRSRRRRSPANVRSSKSCRLPLLVVVAEAEGSRARASCATSSSRLRSSSTIGLEAATAAGLVGVGAADDDAVLGRDDALGLVRGIAAPHADREGLGDVLGDREQLRHGLERLAQVVGIEPRDDERACPSSRSARRRRRASRSKNCPSSMPTTSVRWSSFSRISLGSADELGLDAHVAVRHDVLLAVAPVDDRLEDLDPLARDLRAPQPADQLLALAAEHAAGDHFDPARVRSKNIHGSESCLPSSGDSRSRRLRIRLRFPPSTQTHYRTGRARGAASGRKPPRG